MSGTIRLQERIAGLLECGAPLAEIERRVIEASDLDPEQKSALSRYAIALSNGHDKLRVVPAHFISFPVRSASRP